MRQPSERPGWRVWLKLAHILREPLTGFLSFLGTLVVKLTLAAGAGIVALWYWFYPVEREGLVCALTGPALESYAIEHYGLKPGEKKPPAGCPGADSFEPGIGNFVMNELRLQVPRDYITGRSEEADGPAQSVALSFAYPGMTAGWRSAQSDRSFSALLERSGESHVCFGACMSWRRKSYLDAFVAPSPPDRPNNAKVTTAIVPRPDLGLQSFRSATAEVFFRGAAEAPDYWLACETTLPARCWSEIWLDSRVKVTYRFQREALFAEHDDVRRRLLKKLQEFSEGPLRELDKD